MKKLILLVSILSISLAHSQAYVGVNDNKFQVGVNLQDNATGINLTYDYGLGDNISVGISSTYALGVNEDIDASFGDRFDLKGRFNANLGNVINVDENFDLYPGLNLSLKNFGGHLGARYFFTPGFGVYTELNAPLAKYKTEDLTPAEELHNQFTISFGASFSL
ncbi:DUF6646 family protein [Aestuariibaculum sediminum]|uniref:Outer membrane protein beta-barrel domain-containing protein n=1 Tax=Aestuariibaculum sediminum TaxID=2770637 RepID=A0A8J6Q1K3_9FLAO|nr:DUF6646 family protein [Aestuariibaculum sediminum]MBD0831085.1 hypothetical protein [Aestuariibaculum sediminum]